MLGVSLSLCTVCVQPRYNFDCVCVSLCDCGQEGEKKLELSNQGGRKYGNLELWKRQMDASVVPSLL